AADPAGEVLPYDVIWKFSARDDLEKEPAKQLWAVKKGFKEPILYKRQRVVLPTGQSGYEYVSPAVKPARWSSTGVEAVLIEHNGEKLRFQAEKAPEGSYATYVENSGRGWVMKEYNIGQPTISRPGRLALYFFLNLLHLAVWFAALWLLL